MLTFPQLIKNIRNEAGLTQNEFARVLDVSTILISMIEAGQKDVSKNFIEKLAEKIKVHPSSIAPFVFSGEEMGKLSDIEKKLITAGERMQNYLIEKKSKDLKKYVR